jgi:hypothetical protein
MQKLLLFFISFLLLNISCVSINTIKAQEANNHYFFIDSTKSTACNICLIDDLLLDADYKLLIKKISGDDFKVEEMKVDTLNSKREKLIKLFEKEDNPKHYSIEIQAKNQCLENYSFYSNEELERFKLLVHFNAYLESLDVPIPSDTIFNTLNYKKDKSGKYIIYDRGQKFLKTEQDLEKFFKNFINSYNRLSNYQKSRIDYYCQQYTGKSYSQMDKTEQLMFKLHAENELFNSPLNNIEREDIDKENILKSDLKLQKLKNEYVESSKIKE